MIYLVNMKKGCVVCKKKGKFKQGTFGYLSNKKIVACSEHKEDKMVDLAHIKNYCQVCIKDFIFKRASFGYISDRKRITCSDHKTDDMINIDAIKNRCRICEKDNIFKNSSFGYLSDKKRIACSDHKTDDMIDLAHMKNSCIICNEMCIFKRASYGYLFEPKTHCVVHKKANMYSSNNPTCSECPERPMYGDSKLDDIPVRCEKHKLNTDSDMISRKCDLCGDEYFIPSTETKCRGCLGFIIRKQSKRGVKERKIADLLTSLTSTLGTPVHDKKVKGGCSSKRPDFYYRGFNPTFDLIVEVDENQHSRYTCGIQAEMTRIINIYENDNGGFPLCIIRFNPDQYYYKDKIMKAYKGREDVLKKVISGLKNRTTFEHKIGIIYLFYDQFETITGINITPFDYKYEDRNLIIEHKHPLDKKEKHIYHSSMLSDTKDDDDIKII